MTIILNSIFPVFLIIVLGGMLQRFNLTTNTFLTTSDKLVYYIFFPIMLFWKIGMPESETRTDWNLVMACMATVFVVYGISLFLVRKAGIADYKVGSFSQSCYRFNTYIGMAILLNAVGDEGVRQFGVMIGAVIPFINLLAVSTLIWFSETDYSSREKVHLVIKATLSNPLILACMAGMAYSRLKLPAPLFVDNTFSMLSLVTLPLALISIGAGLRLPQIKGHFKLAMAASFFKLLILPVTGYLFLRCFGVVGLPFTVGMIFFTLPTSTAVYILSSQLHSDVELASAAILVSTTLSFVSLSVAMVLFVP
jgi:malonate transporter